jgi:hypothetical protein
LRTSSLPKTCAAFFDETNKNMFGKGEGVVLFDNAAGRIYQAWLTVNQTLEKAVAGKTTKADMVQTISINLEMPK